MLVVGESELFSWHWIIDGTELSTGSATVELKVSEVGVIKYIQADIISLSTTPYQFPLTYSAEHGWFIQMDLPTSLGGKSVYVKYVHTLTEFDGHETHYVSLDDSGVPVLDDRGASVGSLNC